MLRRRRNRLVLGSVGVALVAVAACSTTLRPVPSPTTSVAQPSDPPAFVDPERHAGGIPTRIDGQPVLVSLDSRLFATTVRDNRPFLFGGLFTSQIIQTCSGGIGPVDPNPLGARGCPRWAVEGAPGRLYFPDGFEMPQGDGPIVLRVHTRDPSAATCQPENRPGCFERIVVEAVAWFGDDATVTIPIGPAEAIGRVLRLDIADTREGPDRTLNYVPADIFTMSIACPPPWPVQVRRIHGDPRHGLLAVFPDVAAREAFVGQVGPEAAGACLGTSFARPGPGRWLAFENLLVLTFGDDEFGGALDTALRAGPNGPFPSVGLARAPEDQGEQTLFDYLAARASGSGEHAWGERLIDAPGGDEDDFGRVVFRDVLRRHAANALVGEVTRLSDPIDADRIGPANVARLDEMGADRRTLFRVTYPSADPALAVEEYVAFHVPGSFVRDWGLIRVAGAPYPLPP